MIKTFLIAIMWLGATATSLAVADEFGNVNGAANRILVTFSDPAMSNAARAGPSRPGYRRRSTSYLVSVGVKRAAKRIAEDFNLVTLDEWPIISLKVHCLVFETPDGVDIEDLLASLQQRPEVDSAQRLNEFEVGARQVTSDADPYANLQHNLVTLELEQAHHWSQGDGTEIAVIDTGADFKHPELRARIVNYQDFVEGGDGEFFTDAHGTAVAGVIAADSNNGVGIIGVAPSTELSVLKACWHQAGRAQAVCNSFTLAKALDYAIQSGTDIINLSLSGPSDGLLARLVEQALDRGIVVVAAAPGLGLSGFPAEIAGVIVVASDEQAESASGNAGAIIRAPGVDILVPVPAGGYDFASGASLSAAQVSGIVALLVARQPGLTPDQIKALLVHSQSAGGEFVNACRALAELLAETGCRSNKLVSAGN